MRIWQLGFEVDDYSMLFPIKDEDSEKFVFDGTKRRDTWIPLAVKKMWRKPLSDAPGTSLSGTIVFTPKALEILQDLIEDSVEVLPLQSKKGQFFGINVIEVINAIDYDASQYRLFKNSGRIMVIEKYVFKEEAIKGKNIFKIVDEPRRWAFVSDAFRERVLQSGLTGFKFKLLWDSENP